MDENGGWGSEQGNMDEDEAWRSYAGPMMQYEGCPAAGTDEGRWDGECLPKSSHASSSKCGGEVGWGALCFWKIDYWKYGFTTRPDWDVSMGLTALKVIGWKTQSLLMSFPYALFEEVTGIGRSLVGQLSQRKNEDLHSPRDKITEELSPLYRPETQEPSPVDGLTPRSQMSPVNPESSAMAGPSRGIPEDSVDHHCDQIGYYLIDWFLKPVAGPMIPMSSLVFCRGVPIRLSPSKSQYEAYWNGIRVSVNVEIPCNGLATKQYLENFAKSISLLRQIRHPSFAQVYGWCLIRKGSASELGIVMEWCNTGSLLSMMRSQKSHGTRQSLGWRQKMELALDYVEGVKHLQEHHQLLLGDVDLGNLLVHCSQEDGHTAFRGKIADLSNSRFILSGVPFTKPTGAWAADQSGASSRQTDIYSLERILWSLAMLGEPHAEIFWSLPTQLHELGEENNETSTIYDHGLHPLPFAQSSGRGPPSELWRLMANIGKEDADGKPTASYICDALTTILQHYMSPRPAVSMDKCDLPQKEQYSSMGIVKSRASEEGTRQPEDSSSSPKKNDIPPMIRDESVKIGRRPVARWFSGVFKGCFTCAQARSVDEWSTMKESSMIKSTSSISLKNEVDVHGPVIERDEDDLILQDSTVMEYSTDETNIESVQVLKKHFREGANWRNFRAEVLKYWRNHPQSSPLRKLANMVEKIPLKATHEELQAILCMMFQSCSSRKIISSKGWKAVQSLLVDVVLPDNLVPCAGFGISTYRLEELSNVILALPAKLAWFFDFDSHQELSPVRTTSRDTPLHSQTTSQGGNLYCITKVQGQKALEYIVKRSRWIDCQLRVKLRGHVRRGENAEEIIDALKYRMVDRVLMWVVHTEASILLKKLPSICTFRGVCQSPLSLVSEHYESRTLFDILQSQGYPGWRTSWTWLEKLIVAKRIAQCLLEFHKVALVHMTLTSNNVLVNQQLNVRFNLGPARFVDSAVPVGDAEWTSPEKWLGDSIYPASDLYSLGVILWELVSGSKPWAGLALSQILVSVINGKRPGIDPGWNRDYVGLIESCWAPDPQSRPKCMEVMMRLDDMQEAARELVSLSSGSAGSGVVKGNPGEQFAFCSATGLSSKDSILHARTIKSTQSEIQTDAKQSLARKDDVAERLTRMSGFTESTHEEQEADAIADFWSAQASSEVGMIGSVQESDCSNISRKLQDNYVVNELIIIGKVRWSIEKQCTNRYTGAVYSIVRSKKWVMPSSWSWKTEVLGPWIAWRSTSTSTCLHRRLRLESTVSGMAREIAVFKKLAHPNLIKLIEVIEDGDQGMLLVSEHMNGISLAQSCYESKPCICEAAARRYMIKMIECLEYLHSCHVIHRDLRPDNVFLGHGQDLKIKLSASSCWLPSGTSMRTDVCGDPHFHSPEMCDLTEGGSYCAYKSDVYALGVCLHVMLFGRPPFQGTSAVPLMDAIKKGRLTLPTADGRSLSKPLKDLLSRMLHKDPDMRLSLQGVADHKWLGDHWRRVLPLMTLAPAEISQRDVQEAVSLNVSKLFEDLPFICSEQKEFSSGEQIFSKQRDIGSLYIVKDGWCCCFLGQETNEYLAFPGSIFGCTEFLLNDNKHRNVDSVHAMVLTIVSQVTWDSAQSRAAYQVIGACWLAALGVGLPAIIICFMSCLILCLWYWLDSVSTRALKTLVNNQGRVQ